MARTRMRKRRKAKLRKNPKYNSTYLKLRQQFVLQPDLNGNLQGQFNSHSLTNFFKNYSAQAYQSLQEIGSVTALFDQYRPVGMKIQFIPRYTEIPVRTDAPHTMPSLVFAYDVDNSGTITYGNLLTRNKAVLKPSNRGWSLYYRIPRVSVSGATQPSITGGWNNLQNEQSYQAGGVRFASEEGFQKEDPVNPGNLIAFDDKLGALLVTYYCEYKERS